MKFKICAAFLVIALLFISGCQTKEDIKVEKKSMGSGFLEISSVPSDADIFVDGVLSGKSPYNIPNVLAGAHNIVIKKSGYEDFSSQVNIEAGKRASIEAKLVAITPVEKKAEAAGSDGGKPETTEAEEKAVVKIEESPTDIKANGKINVGNKFLVYYDFGEGNFTNRRYADSEVFSQRNGNNFVFVRFAPASVKTISKSIDKVEKADCIDKRGEYEFLNSGQTMCIITKEGKVAAIGGNWEKTENTELVWKLFN